MALTLAQQQSCARQLAQAFFVSGNITAGQHFGDLVAAVQGLDNALDATLNQGVAAFGGATTVINALAASVTAPAAGSWTAAQKSMIGAYVLEFRAGLLS